MFGKRRARIRGFPGAERLEGLRRKAVSVTPRARAKQRRRRAAGWAAAGMSVGAALTYLFDPDRGKARRHQLVGRVAGTGRRIGRTLARRGRYAASTARGLARRREQSRRGYIPPNDETLAATVQGQVFGPQRPRGSVMVDVEEGVVVLRGEVTQPREVRQLEKAVRRIDGVRDVRNLLHIPGQPAPNKAQAIRAGR